MLANTRKKIFRRKMLAPWQKGIRKPSWAFGVAALGIPLLAAADFVMLGDQLSQSFGGNGQGYVVVLACLGGIVLLPIPTAHFIHDLICCTQEDRSQSETKGARLAKAVVAAMLAISLVGCFASITEYRISQAQANQMAREQTASLQAASQSETGIVLSSNLSDETQASPESQTLLLTTLLIMSSVYSFSLTWAKASSHALDRQRELADRFRVAASRVDVCALRSIAGIREKEIREYLAARAEYDACALMLKATELCLSTISGPEEDHLIAERIGELLEMESENDPSVLANAIAPDEPLLADAETPIAPNPGAAESEFVAEGR